MPQDCNLIHSRGKLRTPPKGRRSKNGYPMARGHLSCDQTVFPGFGKKYRISMSIWFFIYGEQARQFYMYFRKGWQVDVTGYLRNFKYEDKRFARVRDGRPLWRVQTCIQADTVEAINRETTRFLSLRGCPEYLEADIPDKQQWWTQRSEFDATEEEEPPIPERDQFTAEGETHED